MHRLAFLSWIALASAVLKRGRIEHVRWGKGGERKWNDYGNSFLHTDYIVLNS